MAKGLKKIAKWKSGRPFILGVVFAVLSFILIHRLYQIQIVSGDIYRSNFEQMTTRTREIKSTRGNIYDRNGKLLAHNELSYSLTVEDNGNYETKRIRALSLNKEGLTISRILRSNGLSFSNPFHIILDENGRYAYDIEGWSLDRFRADAYGESRIDSLTDEQKEAPAEELMKYLLGTQMFCVTEYPRTNYTSEELASYGLDNLTRQELLDIVRFRYALFTTSYQRYVRTTIAIELNDTAVAELTENKDSLPGIEITEDTKRVYEDPVYFASIIGYTGLASAEDIAEYKKFNASYSGSSIVGKAGIEKVMEVTLQGSSGEETVRVNNVGKVIAIDEDQRRDPIAGNDVYLTIDKDLQIATYKILEQRIAGILLSVLFDGKEMDVDIEDSAYIQLPSYTVYNALINNSIIDTSHFTVDTASDTERRLARAFSEKQEETFLRIRRELTGDNPVIYSGLSREMQEYEHYIVEDLLVDKKEILNMSAVDKTDEVYLAWERDESISMQEYLNYAASQNWIDVTQIASEEPYIDSSQIYDALATVIEETLRTDPAFTKMLYKYMLYDDRIAGDDILRICYDQGIFDTDDGCYEDFIDEKMTAYELLQIKLTNLELTPAMLALDPCSGSAVITDPNTGEVLACVSYPGYDNNRLSNTMDTDYYRMIAADLSQPFYNKATQAKTAPGSTFKLITATAGLSEGVIGEDTEFDCEGVFDLTETPLRCWNVYGHGNLDLRGAIEESCNVYFCSIAYQMGINAEGNWSDSLSLSKLQNYMKLFDLDKPSGIEIPEAEPQISDKSAIQSSIGQGTHAYTTTQLARYATILANGGTSYDLSLINRVVDSKGNLIREYTPVIQSRLTVPQTTWNALHEGMRRVIAAKSQYNDFPINVAGKTGTAQESKSRPPHAVFIGYAPYESPEIAMALRVPNGYSSTNMLVMSRDIMEYYFGTSAPENIITGRAATRDVSMTQQD